MNDELKDLTYKTGYFKGQPPPHKSPGKCHNKAHLGYLSIRNIKKHKCVSRECVYFEKLDHPYWQDKDKKKSDKKFRKQKQKIEETIKYADAEEVAEMIAGFVWKENEDAEL